MERHSIQVKLPLLTMLLALTASGSAKIAGEISFVIGKTEIRKADHRWRSAKTGAKVHFGDSLVTRAESRCEIHMKPGRIVRVGENSRVYVTPKDIGGAHVKSWKGKLWINIFQPRHPGLNIYASGTISCIRGTVFGIQCNQDHATYQVFKGRIEVSPLHKLTREALDSSFQVTAGQELTIVRDFESYKRRERTELETYRQKERRKLNKYRDKKKRELGKERGRTRTDDAFGDLRKRSFREYKGFQYRLTGFDKDKADLDEWVRWNKKRDAEAEKTKGK